MKLIMTKGLPGSGKSTWAKEKIENSDGRWKRINKDDLRAMIDCGKWSRENEKFILEIRDTVITFALLHGYNVIVDDTNLSPKHEITLRNLVNQYNNDILPKKDHCEFEIKDFTDVSLEECIKRDQKRSNYVGEKVIKQMYNQYLKPKSEVIKDNPNLPTCVICDIDGTLALFGDANPYKRDFLKDKVNMRVYELLHKLKDRTIFLFSGRMDKYKDETIEWLRMNGIPYDYIFMRKTDDVRKDSIVKKELYETEIKNKYNVLFVIDDRNQVVEMWRQAGLTCLQVADGDF